jgi:hypothetical protein
VGAPLFMGKVAESYEWEAESAEDREVFAAYSARAEGTSINPITLLATDYLNHFNEIMMLLDLVPEMPECLDQALAWHPKSYRDHFSDSQFHYRDLAVEAYMHAPAKYREPFEAVTCQMERIVVLTLAQVKKARDEGDRDRVALISNSASEHLRKLSEIADGVILGGTPLIRPDEVGELLARWRHA